MEAELWVLLPGFGNSVQRCEECGAEIRPSRRLRAHSLWISALLLAVGFLIYGMPFASWPGPVPVGSWLSFLFALVVVWAIVQVGVSILLHAFFSRIGND